MTVIERAAIRQTAVAELADAVVCIMRGAPALMLGNQAILHVVFISERPMAVVDIYQATECVVAVVNFFAIGQRLDQQTACGIALVFGNQFATVVAELGFLQQLAVQVVLVRGAAAVEAGFLLDQAVRVIIELVAFAALVFDLGEVELRVVVAIAQLAAVGINPAADEVQVVGVFVAGDTAKFVAFSSDIAVGVVAECASGAAGQRNLGKAIGASHW